MSSVENPASPEDLIASAIAPGDIPDKLYFRIGDVARLAGIKQYDKSRRDYFPTPVRCSTR